MSRNGSSVLETPLHRRQVTLFTTVPSNRFLTKGSAEVRLSCGRGKGKVLDHDEARRRAHTCTKRMGRTYLLFQPLQQKPNQLVSVMLRPAIVGLPSEPAGSKLFGRECPALRKLRISKTGARPSVMQAKLSPFLHHQFDIFKLR